MVHNSCCVVDCKNTGRNSQCKFYTFPRASWKLEKREKWINAVKRKNVDGSPWTPRPTDAICSAHFVGGRKSEEEANPSYIPTIFPSICKNPKINEKTSISSSVTNPLLTPASPKSSKTPAERQQEYRIRQKQKILNNVEEKKKTPKHKIEYQRQYRLNKKMEKAQIINDKKTRADYQREYRLRKKLKAELNSDSDSTEMISREEAGFSGYLAPVTMKKRKKKAEEQLENKEFERVDIKIKDEPIDQHDESTFGLVAQKTKSLTNIQNENPDMCFEESEITIKEEFQLDDIQIKDEPIDQHDESTFGLVASETESLTNIQTEINPIKIQAPSENVLESIASLKESEIIKKECQLEDIQIKKEPIDQYDESTIGLVTQNTNIQTKINSNYQKHILLNPVKVEAPSENVLEPIASVLLPTIKTEQFIDEN